MRKAFVFVNSSNA